MICVARDQRINRPAGCVAVMMVGVTEEVFEDAPDGDTGGGRTRLAKPP